MSSIFHGLTHLPRPYLISQACHGHGDLPTDSANPELCLVGCPSTPMSIPQHWQPKSSNRRQPPSPFQLHSHQHMSNICDVPYAVLIVYIASCLFTAGRSQEEFSRRNVFLAGSSHSSHRLSHHQVQARLSTHQLFWLWSLAQTRPQSNSSSHP